MFNKPMSVNGDTSHDEQPQSAEPAAHHRFPLEWGDLVGFRRRHAAQPAATAQGEAAAVPVASGDGIVVVGKGANIVGEITNCSQVEIAGALEGKVVAEAVIVRAGGCLKGHVHSERAEVHGTLEGEVQVEDHLDIRSTGQVSGELAYGKLSVASGGRLAGMIQIVPEPEKQDPPAEHQEQAAPVSFGEHLAGVEDTTLN